MVSWGLQEPPVVSYISENVRDLGYEASSFYDGQTSFRDLIFKPDRERFDRILENLDHPEQDNDFELIRMRDISGEVHWVRAWFWLSRNGTSQQNQVWGIFINATRDLMQQNRLSHFVETIDGIYLVLDASGNIIEINNGGLRLLNERREDLIGKNWLDNYLPEDVKPAVKSYFQKAIDGALPDRGNIHENEIVTRDGKRLRIRWQHIQERDPSGRVLRTVALGTDITPLHEYEQKIREYSRFPLDNPSPVLRMDSHGDVILANGAAQRLVDELSEASQQELQGWQDLLSRARQASGHTRQELTVNGRTLLFEIVPLDDRGNINFYGMDITDLRATEQQLSDILDNAPAAIFQYILHADGTGSINSMNKASYGIWGVSPEEIRNDPSPLWSQVHPEDIEKVKKKALQAGRDLAPWRDEYRIITKGGETRWLQAYGTPRRLGNGDILFNSVLMDRTREKEAAKARADALKKAIYVLSAALESRDPYTAGHEQRVAEFSTIIARELELDPDMIEGINLAAVIHDIGKISVPFELLNKPTRLSAAEFEVIKAHAQIGADIIGEIEFKWPIHDIVLQHHERQDGSGYPRGLKGEQVLLQARIIGVADTVEAMAADRPYRRGLGMPAAMDEIRQGAGTRYDAEVARVALKLIEENRFGFALA